MDSISSGDPEVFAKMQKPEGWKREEERSSDLRKLMLELEREGMEL